MQKIKKKNTRQHTHRKKPFWKNFKQSFLCLGTLFFLITIYIKSEKIFMVSKNIGEAGLKKLGFKVDFLDIITTKKFSLEEQNKNLAETIKKNLGITENDNIFKISAADIRENIMKISEVKTATVKKILPNTLVVELQEKIPIGIWQKNAKLFLIDNDGSIIRQVHSMTSKMPIITGKDANIHAKTILKIIDKIPAIKNNLDSMTFIKKRRWNIVVRGIQIKLPESNLEKNIKIIDKIMKHPSINQNTIKFIDLRTERNIIINGLKVSQTKAI